MEGRDVVEEKVVSAVNALREWSSHLTKKEEELDKDQYTMQKAAETIACLAKEEPIITLNVGGGIFTFPTDLLAQYPNTFFGALLASIQSGRYKASEEIHIAECKHTFAKIAQYLYRGGRWLDGMQMDEDLKRQVDFFCLEPPQSLLQPNTMNKMTPEIPWWFFSKGSMGNILKCEGHSPHFSLGCLPKEYFLLRITSNVAFTIRFVHRDNDISISNIEFVESRHRSCMFIEHCEGKVYVFSHTLQYDNFMWKKETNCIKLRIEPKGTGQIKFHELK